jgi:hypothetical protein
VGFKSFIARRYAAMHLARHEATTHRPAEAQQAVLQKIVACAAKTKFGRIHGFADIRSAEDFSRQVSVRDYEGMREWMEAIKSGEEDVCWPGRPLYISKTSGTTSGAKYIPITQASMPNHIGSAKRALLSYIRETGNSKFTEGKMIFLQGSPRLDDINGIPAGRLSGIVAHHVPWYLQQNRLPDFATNCIEDWEKKVDAIVQQTLRADMRLISGIPSWVQMYFERLIAQSGQPDIKSIFPNFSLFIYGGVNYSPYRPLFKKLIGTDIPSIETYPASEGFIAYQDSQIAPGLLLNVNDGIYFEFIKATEYFDAQPRRYTLSEVVLDVNYALVLSSNAGLWGYSIGDTVKFVSLSPPRIVVTGRIKHFTSAFGEHVIAEEVEAALGAAIEVAGGAVREFHVAPQVSPTSGLPFHEWLIEFETPPKDIEKFADAADKALQDRNPYYRDLLTGHILRRLVITPLAPGAFARYMESKGKLGGQNKIPRLANDRSMAEGLLG